MRYAVFTDIHANLEALEAVLTKIDELAQEKPIDKIWFLGDLVGYGPNPNECILILRARTDVIIAGNHDWAAVGKLDLEDFSPAARISAEWTAEQLTKENRTFLINLPERLDIGECTLVHGSPYGPLWEYLTSEVLAERSFQNFSSQYCFVGHTHVPVIFQQPDTIANAPTLPLMGLEQSILPHAIADYPTSLLENDGHGEDESEGTQDKSTESEGEEQPRLSTTMIAVQAEESPHSASHTNSTDQTDQEAANNHTEQVTIETNVNEAAETNVETQLANTNHVQSPSSILPIDIDKQAEADDLDEKTETLILSEQAGAGETADDEELTAFQVDNEAEETEEAGQTEAEIDDEDATSHFGLEPHETSIEDEILVEESEVEEGKKGGEEGEEDGENDEDEEVEAEVEVEKDREVDDEVGELEEEDDFDTIGLVDLGTPESVILNAEDRLNEEIEELLSLMGLSESMIQITNEMLSPPEGHWEIPEAYRAIINPGGVGQPRDGDPRAAFMIYDTEEGFEFYRVPYAFNKTQEKIIKAGLPQYLAIRLAYGR